MSASSTTTSEVIRSLVEAVIELTPSGQASHPAVAPALDWLRKEDVAEKAKLPSWVKTKRCYTCGNAIFFAARPQKRQDGSTAWVPMIPSPIFSEKPILDGVGIMFHLNQPTIEDPTPGIQWLPHSVLCGRMDRPMDPELAAIWERTVGKSLVEEEVAIRGLVEMLEGMK